MHDYPSLKCIGYDPQQRHYFGITFNVGQQFEELMTK